MAYSTNQVGLGSYINPSDLMHDEIDYELGLRGLNMSGYPLEDRREAFRRAQLDEIQNTKILYTKNTILDELTIIQIKATVIRQELEIHGPRRELMSRLRHLRLRVLRSNAMDNYQVRMKDELLRELETVYELFATPEHHNSGNSERESSQIIRNPDLEFPPPPHVPRSSEVNSAGDQQQRDSTSTVQSQQSQDSLTDQRTQQTQQDSFQPQVNEEQANLEQELLQRYQQQNQQNQQRLREQYRQQYQQQIEQQRQQERLQQEQQQRQQQRLQQRHQQQQQQFQEEQMEQEQLRVQLLTPVRGNSQPIPFRLSDLGSEDNDSTSHLPLVPEEVNQGLSREEVSRIVENVVANQMEGMMERLMENMQNMLNNTRHNQGTQDDRNRNMPFGQALDEMGFTPIGNPQRRPVNWNEQPAINHQPPISNSFPAPNPIPTANQVPSGNQVPAGNPLENQERAPSRNRGNSRPRNEQQYGGRVANNNNTERENCFKIPINKWQIKFSGDPKGMSVEEFVKRVEVLAKNNQVSDAELLSKANFLFRPESPAEIWYYTFSNKFTSWQILKYHLRLRFEVPNKDKVLERQIRDRKQQSNETFVAYLGEIERLCQQMSRPMDEKTKLDVLFENMKDWYRPHLAFLNISQLTVEALCSLCYELDKSVYRSYAQRNRMYNVNCVEDDQSEGAVGYDEDFAEEVNAVNRVRPPRTKRQEDQKEEIQNASGNIENNILCWNCNQFGHFWRNCTKGKRIFCHICGKADVVISNCPVDHRNIRMENTKNEYREGN